VGGGTGSFGKMQWVQPQGALAGAAGAAGAQMLFPAHGPAVSCLTSHASTAPGDAGTSCTCSAVTGSHLSFTVSGATVADSTAPPREPGAVQLPSHAAGRSNGVPEPAFEQGPAFAVIAEGTVHDPVGGAQSHVHGGGAGGGATPWNLVSGACSGHASGGSPSPSHTRNGPCQYTSTGGTHIPSHLVGGHVRVTVQSSAQSTHPAATARSRTNPLRATRFMATKTPVARARRARRAQPV
jgi:hypothetical protein